MRALPQSFSEYRWAPSTEEIARAYELDPLQVVRFDGNVPAQPAPFARPGAIAGALAQVNANAHRGFPALVDGIARYAGDRKQWQHVLSRRPHRRVGRLFIERHARR